MDGFEVLKERGFISQCSNETALKKQLNSEKTTFYVGFDPTGRSLHVGHLVPMFAMAHLQRAGHRAIALVGGGTARIGDPSGKTETRRILPIETIKENAARFRKQISRFITLDNSSGIMEDNAGWLADLNYIDFLRDIGRHFSVNRMLSFETYKMRLEKGLSFIEFNYQILQSYDYLTLFRKYGCMLQMGGDDQWGNIVAGIELIRRVEGKEVFALTSPLVTRSDGKKMGKTEKGALFLDPEMVSPYEFYQYWINIPDADVEKLLKLFTFIPLKKIKELSSLKDREINRAKEVLAFELTSTVHGREEAERAKSASRAAFGKEENTGLTGIPSGEIKEESLKAGINVIDLFSGTSLCASKSEARRLVTQGGAYINGVKVDSIDTMVDLSYASKGEILLRAGKKRYFRVIMK
ncbi:MAG: tyrosine--tRNA ligase [Spirochaetes bacterium]|nr:MAG: tyrosine--tRNA ligase [Spirochaetota bacterium]